MAVHVVLKEFPGLEATQVGLDSPLLRAQRFLASAYDSVAGLFDTTYPILRKERTAAKGRLTHAEHDIFRAAVVFTGAGLDSVFKEAMRGSIRIQIERSESAREKYVDFVANYLTSGSHVNPHTIATLLTEPEPDLLLKDAYIEKLTGSSLQSQTQVTNTLTALGMVKEKDLYKDSTSLNPLFKARNQIAHESDMTAASISARGTRHRRERRIATYRDMCHVGLNYSQRFLNRLAPLVE